MTVRPPEDPARAVPRLLRSLGAENKNTLSWLLVIAHGVGQGVSPQYADLVEAVVSQDVRAVESLARAFLDRVDSGELTP